MVREPEFDTAYQRALRYLTYRERSEHELNCYLLKKEFSCDTIEKVLNTLKQANYLNDARFAENWGRARMESRKLGRFRLRQELLQKGLAEDLVESTLDTLYEETDEWTLAQDCAEKKMRTLHGLEVEKQKLRLAGYLQRRGFKGEMVYRILDHLNLK